jgi:hypothetical protein
VPSRRYRLLALAMAALAIATLFVLPLLAARIVRGALEAGGAADRTAYADGASPWSWRFRGADDIVAGKVFGDGTLKVEKVGLIVLPTRSGRGEIGFPLTRQADLRRLNLLRLDAASQGGDFGLVVRPTLADPLVRADIPGLAEPVRLDQLAWRDATGQPVPAPTRAAMLRLAFTLPPASTLALRGAGLARAGGALPENGIPIPAGLTAEELLRWRDRQRDLDPLVTLGVAPAAAAPWAPWIAPATYLALLAVGMVVTRRRKDHPGPLTDLANAALSLAGPAWFIAGMQLGPRPAAHALMMFAGGVGYAIYLAWIRALPRWHWRGGWAMSGWPLLAIPVALAIATAAGHAPVWPPTPRIMLYLGWALFQQWLMLAVVAGLLARALPRPMAVLLTAIAFALLHTPNGLLMQLCFVAELGWAWWYLHQRALLPVALAHAASAVIMQACMAGGVLRSLEVSARFLS